MQLRLFGAPPADGLAFEAQARRRGFRLVAGLDEAGRGPLAGPVVAAAVILPSDWKAEAVKDSKQLSQAQRERLDRVIRTKAVSVGVGVVEPAEIDRLNILQATFKAMAAAVAELSPPPDCLLIDGPYSLPLPLPQKGIPGGDRKSLSIAAASIVAKVYRDRLMEAYHARYPAYAFRVNKGYATRAHLEALKRHGPCAIHRLTFRGVRECGPEPG
ncbi:ribonuclease HII [Desulfoglaeba alkanexedens]|uniref:Ribonuclease HII n=1 Tax=Desulfoglaeba alkanexedens ALDC TaxID=980445 RepID=A0A4P8L576_9BACT|nr:ribonuclease HII [Desulfoglaeba alkanexedens]QCQ23119.1 ribonuclease HII [Desulfoglaeba alkanexedens ALDC]